MRKPMVPAAATARIARGMRPRPMIGFCSNAPSTAGVLGS
jgi:hypothetical protein